MRAPARAAFAVSAAMAAMAAAAAPALAADPIMPLGEVRAGMVGEARTVVQGSEIVTFPVRILDVRDAGDGPGGALIYGVAEGPLMERTGGVAQGMSGSPVYVTGADGVPRVIGAIAYGTGDQAGVVTGITPIERMLDSSSGSRQLETGGPRRRVVEVGTRDEAVRAQRRDPDVIALHPLMRWTVSGVSRQQVGGLQRGLASRGIALSSVGLRGAHASEAPAPGSSITALVSGGDIGLGATGTVTYVDGDRVLAFGHPFLGTGRARFLLGGSYVIGTIAAPIAAASYKLAEPGAVIGAVVGDRTEGITAVVGASGGIPAVARARDLTRGTSSTVRGTLAPDERILPLTAGLLQTEPALRVRDGLGGGTLRLTLRITSPALERPFVYRNTYAAYGDVVSVSSLDLRSATAMLTQNSVRSIPISRIEVSQTLERRVRAASIVDARVSPRVVTPGEMATLRLRIRPWRSGVTTVPIRFRVPAGLRPGVRTLRIVPNTGGGFDATPPELDAELGLPVSVDTTRLHASTVAAVSRRAAGLPGPRTTQVVEAARDVLGGRNDAVRLLIPGESGREGRVLSLDHVIVNGRARVKVRVRG